MPKTRICPKRSISDCRGHAMRKGPSGPRGPRCWEPTLTVPAKRSPCEAGEPVITGGGRAPGGRGARDGPL